MSKKITQDIAEKRVNVRLKKINTSLKKPFIYNNAISTILFLKCNIDGHEWKISYNTFVNSGTGCNVCAIKKNTEKKRTPLNVVNNRIDERLKEINSTLIEPFHI